MINKLNKILVIFIVIFIGLFTVKVLTMKRWEQHYYTGSVSNPVSFPIYIFNIYFSNKESDTDSSLKKDIAGINNFKSYWGKNEFYKKSDPSFLPEELIIQYMDFRTKNYYSDTIALPVAVIEEVFKEAKKSGKSRNYQSYGDRDYKDKLGLGFHIGIANDGNIVFWLVGDNYYTEFYRTQLTAKPLPSTLYIRDEKISERDQDNYIEYPFIEIPEHIKATILQTDVSNANYKDSIPAFFE